jgi:predicted  nucleic acid-binding Zn-ribbon protein
LDRAKDWERESRGLLSRMKLLREDAGRQEERLVALRTSLTELLDDVKGVLTRIEILAGQSDALERQHQTALDAIRDELQVATESTIPVLVAANQLHLERLRAETAVQVMRQVAVTGNNKEEI